MPFLSAKDESDIRFGCRNDVDFIFASFTRRPEDVNAIRAICVEEGKPHINIIPKIENQEVMTILMLFLKQLMVSW